MDTIIQFPSAEGGAPRRRWLAGVALAGAFLAGGVTLPLLAATARGAAMPPMTGGHAGMHGMALGHVSAMLDRVGASADQKARIGAILRDGFAPMGALRHRLGEDHAALQAILSPTIDRSAVERSRVEDLVRIDEASRRFTRAIIDAAEVLTVGQREKLAALISQPDATT